MCFQAMFLGDVLADQAGEITFTDGIDTDVIPIPKGSWWANPLTFYAWVNAQLTTAEPLPVWMFDGGQGQAYITAPVPPPNHVITITGGGRVASDVGLPNSYWDVDEGERFLPGWITTFPPRSYSQSAINLDGVSVRGHDGSAYSIQGENQRKVSIGLHLDRREGRREYLLWRNLWRRWWSQGRSVSFWLELPPIVDSSGICTITTSAEWGEQIGKFDQLVAEPPTTVWRPERLVAHKENRDVDGGETDFLIKRKRDPTSNSYTDLFWIP
jgi:hypothetical protein